ncbi:MAG TPA: hypothetical protein VHM90_15470, partial [Phycisphaerae bacterium]|nr:hypothetical protein [Phycisphaerae bacterium]
MNSSSFVRSAMAKTFRRGHVHRSRHSACKTAYFEALEQKVLMSVTAIWTGGGGNSLWSNGNNWKEDNGHG